MLEFETSTGNLYAWDDEVGLFIPFSPAMRSVLDVLSNHDSVTKEKVMCLLKENIEREEISFCYDWIRKWNKIKTQIQKTKNIQTFTESDIRYSVLKFGLLRLTLCITEDCNFMCKYCAYSDFYKYTRRPSDKYMKFSIAKKAIDYYFSLLDEGKRYNPLRRPAIGFYGGEPLLNFKLIKDLVDYIENEYKDHKTIYTITTNGSLLDKEKANWLMKFKFIIDVSLDGPEEEHDRLRVYTNGNGTFRDVMKNVSSIMIEGYQEIGCLPVFDWRSNLFKREEFFNRQDVPRVQGAFPVDDVEGCSYYQQFTEEEFLAFMEQFERARNFYFMNLDHHRHRKKTTLFDDLIGQAPRRALFRSISIYPHHPLMPFTGACIPGRKIFVDVNGFYHLCEKVNSDFPIGNVNEGLNFKKIYKLIVNYNSCMDKCPECGVARRCNFCYKSFATDKDFLHSSTVCKEVESNMKRSFIEAFEIAEKFPEFIDDSNIKYNNIRKYYNSYGE
ncbi:MAG: molybdenum cofactor biosynthesis protein A [Methanosaeta sp. PtaB.Bin039]|nr:MAG: molybdenum cofactor biosynthesis protein A [Methanosaeta sp. PtaB.Bin039]